ncbi:hypothetical protein V6N12_036924 [Hibiscus sabdariffa]|uniref:Uncharacterized protein n=1 Tax=Hibiscus sabdariffa TaxID=183260 RepID=A0ABR1ZXX1_9ROSI
MWCEPVKVLTRSTEPVGSAAGFRKKMWLIWFMLELMAIKGPEYTGVCWFRVMMVSGRQRVGELVAELVRAWEKIWENRNFKAHVGWLTAA